MKEKILELVKVHAAELGIKVLGLTGESLVKLANNLANARTEKVITNDSLTSEKIKDIEISLRDCGGKLTTDGITIAKSLKGVSDRTTNF